MPSCRTARSWKRKTWKIYAFLYFRDQFVLLGFLSLSISTKLKSAILWHVFYYELFNFLFNIITFLGFIIKQKITYQHYRYTTIDWGGGGSAVSSLWRSTCFAFREPNSWAKSSLKSHIWGIIKKWGFSEVSGFYLLVNIF